MENNEIYQNMKFPAATLEYFWKQEDNVIGDSTGNVFTTLRTIDEEHYGKDDSKKNVLPVGEKINNGVKEVVSLAYDNVDAHLFPYLYPNGIGYNTLENLSYPPPNTITVPFTTIKSLQPCLLVLEVQLSILERDLYAFIKQYGIPQLFVTFSCDEDTWPGLLEYAKYGKPDTTVKENPVFANHYCYERLQAMMKYILKNGYIGKKVQKI